MERIKCAAVKQDGVVYQGKRHCHCFALMRMMSIKYKGLPDTIQGFVTYEDRFVTRQEAEAIARASGQLTGPLIGSIFTSEDLY